VPRRLQLAAEEPEGLLTQNQEIDRFLCRALRGEPSPWATLGAVTGEEFLARCRHHGVAGLLFQGIRSGGSWSEWPQAVRQALEHDGMAGVAQDLLRRHHLERLVQELDVRGIPCLLTKGEALATGLYPTPGTRARSDIDLFIRIADILAVRNLVQTMGYRVYPPIFKSHQFTVMRQDDPAGGIRFDIHWRILNDPRYARSLSFEEAFANSVEVPDLAPARMLCSEDALLLACMHRFGSVRHDPDRLIWITDIHALVSSMNSETLARCAAKAVEKNLQRECLDGLRRAQDCFHTPIPRDFIERMRMLEDRRPRLGLLAQSQLCLLVHDWRELPDRQARLGLLQELFLPSGEHLLRKYRKNSKLWLPVLYLRQIVGGIYDRLMLR
jgi:hypothetical protein